MNSDRLIPTIDKKFSAGFISTITHRTGAANMAFSELDIRDWVLTPEIRDAAARIELNFNMTGNPDGNHIRLTHNLKTFLKHLQMNYPPSTIKKTGDSIFQCFNVFFTNLNSYPMGRVRAVAAYNLIDRELEFSSNITMSCRKGCTACCRLVKEITYDEADLLAFLVKNGDRIDMQRLNRQIANSTKNKKKGQRKESTAGCLFLGKNHLCTVYEYRPMVCRKYSVTSPPDECSKKRGLIRQSPMIVEEVVVSAALSCRGNHYGAMPGMLDRALKAAAPNRQVQEDINVIRIGRDASKRYSELRNIRPSNKEPAANRISFSEIKKLVFVANSI